MPADYAVKEKNSTDLDLNTESDTLDSFLDVQEVEAVDFVFEKKPVYEFFKRVFDIILSFIALIVLSPVFLIIALVIIIDDRSASPIFTQKRCGKDGRVFNVYKFRTMCADAEKKLGELKEQNEMDGPVFKIKDDPRITRVGKFLRKTSLDELPQFFNIIKGDISFVGPRSPLPREVENYTDYSMQRLSVIGGLSCYWQISGRSQIDFSGMVELDYKYIKERGFLTDLKILLLTLPAVIRGDGAY